MVQQETNMATTSKTKYVSDIIGENYLSWGNSLIRKIFITTPTGSGKTTFILHNLLEKAISENRKILYLVNREILVKQLYSELDTKIASGIHKKFLQKNQMIQPVRNYITIMTYQSIEQKVRKNRNIIFSMREEYFYIVYDECHYFYSDSTFNTNTMISFEILLHAFHNGIQIFMSATMNKIKNYIETRWSNPQTPNEWDVRMMGKEEYIAQADYSNINIKAFKSIEELQNGIINSISDNTKWLIFVDSIKLGKKIKRSLNATSREMDNCLRKDDIVLVTADYAKDDGAVETVNEIVKNNYSDKKVLIATPVIDNGISIHDIDLRNIVILTDMEETFIQMLGRKRNQGEPITLYISDRSIEYFKQRLCHVKDVLALYDKYNQYYQTCIKYYQRTNLSVSDEDKVCFAQREYLDYIMNDIISSERLYNLARKFLWVEQSQLFINDLSIKKYQYLAYFYNNMIECMETDPGAFIRVQCEWLGKADEADEIINNAQETYDDYCYRALDEAIQKVLDKELSSDENKNFKADNQKFLEYFFKKNPDCENDIENLGKNDRPISSKSFNRAMELANMPYGMEGRGEKFVISRISEN